VKTLPTSRSRSRQKPLHPAQLHKQSAQRTEGQKHRKVTGHVGKKPVSLEQQPQFGVGVEQIRHVNPQIVAAAQVGSTRSSSRDGTRGETAGASRQTQVGESDQTQGLQKPQEGMSKQRPRRLRDERIAPQPLPNQPDFGVLSPPSQPKTQGRKSTAGKASEMRARNGTKQRARTRKVGKSGGQNSGLVRDATRT